MGAFLPEIFGTIIVLLIVLFLPVWLFLLATFLNHINDAVVIWQRLNSAIIRRLGGKDF